mmetsp:Transcript_20651/g.59996  ORF Transcript_20651/g.59996 Transcript_20651/m.59996 type:complete len:360 (-) Transcript_20651:239-1318(-)
MRPSLRGGGRVGIRVVSPRTVPPSPPSTVQGRQRCRGRRDDGGRVLPPATAATPPPPSLLRTSTQGGRRRGGLLRPNGPAKGRVGSTPRTPHKPGGTVRCVGRGDRGGEGGRRQRRQHAPFGNFFVVHETATTEGRGGRIQIFPREGGESAAVEEGRPQGDGNKTKDERHGGGMERSPRRVGKGRPAVLRLSQLCVVHPRRRMAVVEIPPFSDAAAAGDRRGDNPLGSKIHPRLSIGVRRIASDQTSPIVHGVDAGADGESNVAVCGTTMERERTYGVRDRHGIARGWMFKYLGHVDLWGCVDLQRGYLQHVKMTSEDRKNVGSVVRKNTNDARPPADFFGNASLTSPAAARALSSSIR